MSISDSIAKWVRFFVSFVMPFFLVGFWVVIASFLMILLGAMIYVDPLAVLEIFLTIFGISTMILGFIFGLCFLAKGIDDESERTEDKN